MNVKENFFNKNSLSKYLLFFLLLKLDNLQMISAQKCSCDFSAAIPCYQDIFQGGAPLPHLFQSNQSITNKKSEGNVQNQNQSFYFNTNIDDNLKLNETIKMHRNLHTEEGKFFKPKLETKEVALVVVQGEKYHFKFEEPTRSLTSKGQKDENVTYKGGKQGQKDESGTYKWGNPSVSNISEIKEIFITNLTKKTIQRKLKNKRKFSRKLKTIHENPSPNESIIPISTKSKDIAKLPINTRPTLEEKIYPRFRQCVNKDLSPKFEQRGNYWILHNYITAEKRFKCDESITYTTHGEYYFLDNLVAIAQKWQGPVSVSVYAPGKDFAVAVKIIKFLRQCVSEDVRNFVTFHLFFDLNHFPEQIPTTLDLNLEESDESLCASNFTFPSEVKSSYRISKRLSYPINFARNIARRNALTYFNCPLDIELYPSPNMIPGFLNMLQQPDVSDSPKRRVYVLPTFEIEEDHEPPHTKQELLSMLQEKRAYLFHEKICYNCHFVPEYQEWLSASSESEISVFHIGKKRLHYIWEPFYIGTEEEPLFDERLTWEGRGDKMPQAYSMCLLDYEFHTLDNAFLVHKPGIQLPNPQYKIDKTVKEQRDFIFYKLSYEYQRIYGKRKGCQIMGLI